MNERDSESASEKKNRSFRHRSCVYRLAKTQRVSWPKRQMFHLHKRENQQKRDRANKATSKERKNGTRTKRIERETESIQPANVKYKNCPILPLLEGTHTKHN